MVDGILTLSLDDDLIALMVDFHGISLDLGMVLYYYAPNFQVQVLLC
jgi:hypothetical protein